MSTPGKQREWKNPVIRWIEYRMPIFTFIDNSVGTNYPTPRNLSYWWNFGSLAGVMLVIMIATGIMLAMQYTPQVSMAFVSVDRIMRDVNYGWLLRYLHMNGGSMFFILVYIHLFRGMYFGSFKNPRELVWILGVFMLLAMMATAFMGYVLPWGQMSYWGATVITSLFSAVPAVGREIVTWLWGGFTIGNPTLNRFYSLHYLLPFILFALVFLHLWALHVHRSGNPTGVDPKSEEDTIPFHPYYTIKDAFGLGVFLIFFLSFVFFAPDFFGEPDNYIEANTMLTPPHIVPEWYFLPFYAILRAINFSVFFIPAKLGGVIAMFSAVLILIALPWLDRGKVRSARFRPVYKQFFWIFVADTILLGFIGSKPPMGYWIPIGQAATAYYFLHFLVILPLISKYEHTLTPPESISASVLKSQTAK